MLFILKLTYAARVAIALAVLVAIVPAHAVGFPGQGTWESTLQGRDLDGNPTNGFEAYYDTDLNITWLNTYTNNVNSWDEAMAWVAGLNIYGISGWRLPHVEPVNGTNFVIKGSYESYHGYCDGTSDLGWNLKSNKNELGHLYYVTLGILSGCDPSPGKIYNDGPFKVLTSLHRYWTDVALTGTEFVDPYLPPWVDPKVLKELRIAFSFEGGVQEIDKTSRIVNDAWAVHAGDVKPPPRLGIELVDPFPDLLDGTDIIADHSNEYEIKSNINKLTTGGRTVYALAADGAATVLLRIKGGSVGQELDISIEQDPHDGDDGSGCRFTTGLPEQVCGAIGKTGEGVSDGAAPVTVKVRDTAEGPMAFAVYHAPLDFAWNDGVHRDSEKRRIYVSIKQSGSHDSASYTYPITIIRPLLVFVHGLWSTSDDLRRLAQMGGNASFYSIELLNYGYSVQIHNSIPDVRWYIDGLGGILFPGKAVFYPQGSSLGVRHAALSVQENISIKLDAYRSGKNVLGLRVAARKVDAIGHSMGAVTVRHLSSLSNYFTFDKSTVRQGPIHKFISIGGPHLGSPFAASLVLDENICHAQLSSLGGYYSFRDCPNCVEATSDLMPKSLQPYGYLGSGAIGDMRGWLNEVGVSNLLSDLRSKQLQGSLPPLKSIYIAGRLPKIIYAAFDKNPPFYYDYTRGVHRRNNQQTPKIKRDALKMCPNSPLTKAFQSRLGVEQLLSSESDGMVPVRSQLNGLVEGDAGTLVKDGFAHTDYTRDYLYSVPALRGAVYSEFDLGEILHQIISKPLTSDTYTEK